MKITRREAIKLVSIGGGALVSPFGLLSSASAQTATDCEAECIKEGLPASQTSPPLSPQIQARFFEQPLYVPQYCDPALSKDYPIERRGEIIPQPIDYYEVTMSKQVVEIFPAWQGKLAITAEAWVYQRTDDKASCEPDGNKPRLIGPFIHQKKLRESCIRFINKLGKDKDNEDICTSVHLHGMASLPEYDGYAEDLIPCEHYKDYFYPNNRASILWYHDHAVHKTSRNVYMGLAGMYIVDYDCNDFCEQAGFDSLPKDEFEIPLVIQDKTFRQVNQSEWELVFNDRRRQGSYSDIVLVNGVPWPHLKVQRRKYFFRILNASASRTYQLTLSQSNTAQTSGNNAYTMTVVGSDAGLLGETVPLTAPKTLRMGIGERYGVVIDFAKFPSDVKHVYLRNQAFPFNLGTESSVIMRFDLEGEPVTTPDIPNRLGILSDREAMIARATNSNQTFRFGRGSDWTINGQTWDVNRVDARPGYFNFEIWNLVNTGGWAHPIHVHLVDFRIVSRNGQLPPPYERGWKDVVLLNPNESVQIVTQFAPHAGKYMMHCHNLVHEDHDMMTQFEVINPGGDPDKVHSPLRDPAKPLPPKNKLGSANPPTTLIEDIPCQFISNPLPNNCPEKPVPIPEDCCELIGEPQPINCQPIADNCQNDR